MRDGAALGVLPFSGIGAPVENQPHASIADMKASCGKNNRALLASLDENPNSSELLSLTRADSCMGRMTDPVEISQLDLDKHCVARRFAVEQGLRPDGSLKLRPCDDETASGTNPALLG